MYNLWLNWIASKTDQTYKSQINSETDNDQPSLIKQSIIINMQLDRRFYYHNANRKEKLEDWRLM